MEIETRFSYKLSLLTSDRIAPLNSRGIQVVQPSGPTPVTWLKLVAELMCQESRISDAPECTFSEISDSGSRTSCPRPHSGNLVDGLPLVVHTGVEP